MVSPWRPNLVVWSALDVIGSLLCNRSRGVTFLAFGAGDPAWDANPPAPDKSLFPKKDQILGVLEAQHARVAQALSTVDPSVLATPAHEKRRAHFPTVGDFAIFLMTAHEMDHLGQIAAWRRAMGLGAPS